MQNEFAAHAVQTLFVVFVHGVVSYVPLSHGGVHDMEELPPGQYMFAGQLRHIRSALRLQLDVL